jgi:hypothetical protein
VRNQRRSEAIRGDRRITPDEADYQRLWQVVNKNNWNRYDGYQSKTSRPLHIFALTAS